MKYRACYWWQLSTGPENTPIGDKIKVVMMGFDTREEVEKYIAAHDGVLTTVKAEDIWIEEVGE